MANIKEADRGNIISKGTDKKLRRFEELTTEKTGQGGENLGEKGE